MSKAFGAHPFPKVSLVDIANRFYQGINTVADKMEYAQDGFPIIQAKHITSNYLNLKNVRYTSRADFERYEDKYRPTKGDILLSNIGTIGKSCVVDKEIDFLIAWNVFLISTTENADSVYVNYLLEQLDQCNYYNDLITGNATKFINKTTLGAIEIPFPPLPEQQKIAAILTSVDEVIEQTQAQIDKLKDFKTAMMQELLTRGVGVDGKPHTEFKDSPVGRIPKGWNVLQISTLCSHIVDCVNKTASVVDYQTPYKMIRTTNVRHGRVDTENVRNVSKETYEAWIRRLLPENGDLIFTREAPVGECGILKDARGVFLGQRTMMYRADETKTSSKFLMYSLMSDYGKQQLEDFSGGSTVPHMRVPDCGKILIKTPSKEEQYVIVNSLNSIDISIEIKETKLRKITDTKKALMQDLLTGKVRVLVGES
jgi:type I restriction enzyme S subunit